MLLLGLSDGRDSWLVTGVREVLLFWHHGWGSWAYPCLSQVHILDET